MDAFTSTPFTGNPASVCLVPTEPHLVADELTGGMGALTVPTLKAIASEMNHSETAFLATRPPGLDYAHATDFHLRWFTPKVEVPLCGHVRTRCARATRMGCGRGWTGRGRGWMRPAGEGDGKLARGGGDGTGPAHGALLGTHWPCTRCSSGHPLALHTVLYWLLGTHWPCTRCSIGYWAATGPAHGALLTCALLLLGHRPSLAIPAF